MASSRFSPQSQHIAMDDRSPVAVIYGPFVGCATVLIGLCLLCVVPHSALEKLHLSGSMATLVIVGIVVGGLINIPVLRWDREVEQQQPTGLVGMMGWSPVSRRITQTILAVNVGGCVIPVLLALYELGFIINLRETDQEKVWLAAAITITASTLVCFALARPINGIGIALPTLLPTLVPVLCVWTLLGWSSYYNDVRAPIAFVGGVFGTLIGADLFHIRDFSRVNSGMISIGGAGTFDGIVIAGLLAAFLA